MISFIFAVTMCLVPKFVLLSLLVSWSIVTSVTTATLAHKDHVPCTASLDPQNLIARQFTNTSVFEVIRCSARISNEYSFTHPVFDLSFGLTPVTGIFIVRGKKQCSPNKELCWSDFKIPSQALRQLLLPSEDEENSVLNAGDTFASQVTHSVIDFTCNVADASRNNSLTVRCLDSGTIRFANGKTVFAVTGQSSNRIDFNTGALATFIHQTSSLMAITRACTDSDTGNLSQNTIT